MNLHFTILCRLTQIWHLESTLLYHIRKEKDGSNGQGKLVPKKNPNLVCQRKQKWKPSSRSYKKAIRSTSIKIHVDWWLGKQLRTIFEKRMKKMPYPCWFRASIQIHIFCLWAQKGRLVLEAQINFPYENFPNMPAERKRPRSTLSFIDLNKFWRKKKKTEHDLY